MKDNVFVISDLDNGWGWQDIYSDNDVETYCLEELDVPEEHIDQIKCYNNAFQLTLKRQRNYRNEDWYVNLTRCA